MGRRFIDFLIFDDARHTLCENIRNAPYRNHHLIEIPNSIEDVVREIDFVRIRITEMLQRENHNELKIADLRSQLQDRMYLKVSAEYLLTTGIREIKVFDVSSAGLVRAFRYCLNDSLTEYEKIESGGTIGSIEGFENNPDCIIMQEEYLAENKDGLIRYLNRIRDDDSIIRIYVGNSYMGTDRSERKFRSFEENYGFRYGGLLPIRAYFIELGKRLSINDFH